MLLSLVVPCYNESAVLLPFMEEVGRVAAMLSGDVQTELIFIDDGSSDSTLHVVQELATRYAWVRWYSFSRNFGKESAILAGLAKARGDYTAVIDADLQHPPALLPQMLRAVREEGYDCAGARRTRKGDPIIRSFWARMFYRFINLISETKLADGTTDYKLLSRRAVDALLAMPEYNRFSKGLYQWIGFRTKWIEYENVQRVAGETKWSFWELLKYALEGILAFSTAPLALALLIGGGFVLISLSLMITLAIRNFSDIAITDRDVVIICAFSLVGGVQLLCLGIFGLYLAKAYKEGKHRPHYIIARSCDDPVPLPPHVPPRGGTKRGQCEVSPENGNPK